MKKKKRVPLPFGLPKTIRFNQEVETKLQLIPHQELDALRRGAADETSFHTIAARLNVGSMAVRWHWGENVEAVSVMDAALNAIANVGNRGNDAGKWGVSGDEYRAIGAGLNLTDEAQKNLTRRQFGDALEYVLKVATK